MIPGKHNQDLQKSIDRLNRQGGYRDLSTIMVVPAIGGIPPKVVGSWLNLQAPMNNRFMRMFLENMEVGAAYTYAVEAILNHPELSKWKYMLTVETDNIIPSDGLLMLYENIKEYDAVGGLYWTKGEGGQPMIYGDPNDPPLNFRPQIPKPETIQRCNGLGMGFTLFKISMFKDPALRKPWFKTLQTKTGAYTQDLYFFEDASKQGYKFACDTRVRVGHYDYSNDTVW